MRTLEWDDNKYQLRLIDQRLLPGKLEYFICSDEKAVAVAIRDMTVRGAPAIGVTAAFGLALAAYRSTATDLSTLKVELEDSAEHLLASRPTAVNLAWGIRRMLALTEQPVTSTDAMKELLLTEAKKMAEEDVETNRRMANHGAHLIQDGDTILHHCNTGSLAAVDWGTALGVVRMAHEQGKRIRVLVDETRPRLQGMRLTAWELEQYGIPYEIICDGAAGHFLRTGQVQKVFFGADRVAMNGDVANKIGTYMLALAAYTNQVPVYPVVPTSSIDLNINNGDRIPIEERDPSEVLEIEIKGTRVAPLGAKARNPAFDITPNYLISAIVTENGVVHPPFSENLPRAVRSIDLQ